MRELGGAERLFSPPADAVLRDFNEDAGFRQFRAVVASDCLKLRALGPAFISGDFCFDVGISRVGPIEPLRGPLR